MGTPLVPAAATSRARSAAGDSDTGAATAAAIFVVGREEAACISDGFSASAAGADRCAGADVGLAASGETAAMLDLTAGLAAIGIAAAVFVSAGDIATFTAPPVAPVLAGTMTGVRGFWAAIAVAGDIAGCTGAGAGVAARRGVVAARATVGLAAGSERGAGIGLAVANLADVETGRAEIPERPAGTGDIGSSEPVATIKRGVAAAGIAPGVADAVLVAVAAGATTDLATALDAAGEMLAIAGAVAGLRVGLTSAFAISCTGAEFAGAGARRSVRA